MRINWEYHPLQSQLKRCTKRPRWRDGHVGKVYSSGPVSILESSWPGENFHREFIMMYTYIYICISNLMWLNLIWCHQTLPDSSPRCHDCQDFCLPLLGGFHWTSKPCAEIPSVSSPLHSKWWSRENLLKRASGVRIRKDTSLSFLSLTVPLDTSLSFHILGIIYIYTVYIYIDILWNVFFYDNNIFSIFTMGLSHFTNQSFFRKSIDPIDPLRSSLKIGEPSASPAIPLRCAWGLVWR